MEKVDRPTPPISRARKIAKDFNLDQVLILGRSVSGGYQTMTTYGKDRAHCRMAAQLGDALMELLTTEGPDFRPAEKAVHEAVKKVGSP